MSPPPLCFPSSNRARKKKKDGEDDADSDGEYDSTTRKGSDTVHFTEDTASYPARVGVGPRPNRPRKLIRGNKSRIKLGCGWGIDWGHDSGRKDNEEEALLNEATIYRDVPASPSESPLESLESPQTLTSHASPLESPESPQTLTSHASQRYSEEQSNDIQEEILRIPEPNRHRNLLFGNSPRNQLNYGWEVGLPPKDEENGDILTADDPYPGDAPVLFTPGSSRGSKRSKTSKSNSSVKTLTRSARERKKAYQDPIHERVDTYTRLVELRNHMESENLDYYVVMSEDAHQSEHTAEADKRREWITNFTGSAGQAIISKTAAYLITDSRYWHQAEKELDENWTLIRVGMSSVPQNWVDWISDRVYESRVGIDLRMISYETATRLDPLLQAKRSRLVYPSQNLIDLIWEDKPTHSKNKIYVQAIGYTGKDASEKLMVVRDWIKNVPPSGTTPSKDPPSASQQHVGTLVTDLACIAYVLNLGGDDIPFNPGFMSYLYIGLDRAILFVEKVKVEQPAGSYLQNLNVEIRDYNSIWWFLHMREWGDGKVIISPQTPYAISLLLTRYRYTIAASIIEEMMSVKNEIEIGGLKYAYLRDSACYVQFLAWLDEKMMSEGLQITEWEAAWRLTEFRNKAKNYMGLAYENISATGPNAALPHYTPLKSTSFIIDRETPYLNDSGGLYLDGTCATARTVHFGHPTTEQCEAYTRVLQGHIAIDSAIFPKGTTGRQLGVLARKNLWQGGMNYIHGTGHGVRSSLKGMHDFSSDVPLTHGHILTNELGYYKPNEFGIRIGSVLVVREVPAKHADLDSWLGFERLTSVPIQTRMVHDHMLSNEEKEWLVQHNRACLEALEGFLHDDERAVRWLHREADDIGVAAAVGSNTDYD